MSPRAPNMRHLLLHPALPALFLFGLAAAVPVPATADCIDPRECLCAANADDGALYEALVEGADDESAQLEILTVIRPDPLDPHEAGDSIVQTDLYEDPGTRVLVRYGASWGWGYLVLEGGSARCATGAYGDSLSISRDDAILLSTVQQCAAELATVPVSGRMPDCDDTADMNCNVASDAARPGLTFLLFAAGALAFRRARRVGC